MFDFIFIILLMVSRADESVQQVEIYANQQPTTIEECQSYLPKIIDQYQKDHPDIAAYGWCVPEKWPFPPPKQPKGSI